MNLGPTIAALRHLGTYAAGCVTGLMLLGVNHDTAQQVVDGIIQISKSMADVLQAIGVIAPLILGWLAARSATAKAQVKSIGSMSVENATAAVAALPAEAKADIKLATIPDKTLVSAVAAMPDVMKIEVKPTSSGGVASAAADPLLSKVVVQQ